VMVDANRPGAAVAVVPSPGHRGPVNAKSKAQPRLLETEERATLPGKLGLAKEPLSVTGEWGLEVPHHQRQQGPKP
jgi:hypothetical protein